MGGEIGCGRVAGEDEANELIEDQGSSGEETQRQEAEDGGV